MANGVPVKVEINTVMARSLSRKAYISPAWCLQLGRLQQAKNKAHILMELIHNAADGCKIISRDIPL